MRRDQIWALVILAMGVLIILIPWVLFPVCGVGRFTPPPGTLARMHGCDGTLKAATLLGILVTLSGLLPFMVKQRWVNIVTIAVTVVCGILLILCPTVLTGVCKVATMPCVYGTKPALIIAGIVLILAGGAGALVLKKTP